MRKNITAIVRKIIAQILLFAMVTGVMPVMAEPADGNEGIQVVTETPAPVENPGDTQPPAPVENPGDTQTPPPGENPGDTQVPAPIDNPETPGNTENTETPVENQTPQIRTGSVSNASTAVNVRAGAGTGYSVVTKVYVGQIVNILEETVLSNQKIWYHISFSKEGSQYEGWISGDYLTVNQQTTPSVPEETPGVDTSGMTDEEYVASLMAAGFPASYCTGLLELHKQYPGWQFVPVVTGLDWNYVVENESVIGRNLVQDIVNDARKSTDTRAYDWNTNTWYGFDGSNWVCASTPYIAYCLDPRNFFDPTYIFQFETLEYEAYQSSDGVRNILANSFMSGDYADTDGVTRNYAQTFVDIGVGLGVSPYHLASRCLQEQGTKGTSPLISGTYGNYKGYFNHFNVGAYTTSTASATLNGLAYAKRVGWDSIYKSLMGGSSVVADRYVKKGQNTVYFEKFNVVNSENLFSHQYMTNVMAAFSEGSKISKAYTDKNAAFVFRIPVYENMPETPVTMVDNGNPNNWLAGLWVEGYGLTPTFKPETTEYSLIVADEVGNIRVGATPVVSKATVTATGNYTLNYGENVVTVTAIAENGSARTYTIRVVRQQNVPTPEQPAPTPEQPTPNPEQPTPNPEQPTPTPEQPAPTPEQPTPELPAGSIVIADGVSIQTGYNVTDYISGIPAGSSAADILANIVATNCSVKILNKDGDEQTQLVGTGNVVAIYDTAGNLLKSYKVVLFGDVNGDGKVSMADQVALTKQILGMGTLADVYHMAGDASKDGRLSNKDLVMVQKHILGTERIVQ